MNKHTIRLALIFLLAALAIGSRFYVFSVLTRDHLKFQRGELVNLLLARRNTIQDFPAIDVTRQGVSYTYSAHDGTAPDQIKMNCESSEAIDAPIAHYADYCAQQVHLGV